MSRPRKRPLPRGVYERQRKDGPRLWVSFAWSGRIEREESPVQTVDGAARHVARRRAQVAAGLYQPGMGTGEQTLSQWAPRAFDVREKKGVRTIERERQLYRDHVAPYLGSKPLSELTPRDVELWIDQLVTAGELAPKSILNAAGVLSTLLVRARFDGLVSSVATRDLPPGTLPAPVRRRAKRAWRTTEVVSLVSDTRIPMDRRLAYLIAASTGARLGEVAGMRWRDIDADAPELWRWSLRTQYDGQPLKGSSRRGGERPREIPIHPVLQRELAAWKVGGWAMFVGRVPTPADFVVPRVDGAVHSESSLGAKAVHRHCLVLGIDDDERDFHSFRRWMITTARAGGARELYLERVTHNAKGSMLDRYTYAEWAELCAAVRCLHIEVRRGAEVTVLRRAGTDDEAAEDAPGPPIELHQLLHQVPRGPVLIGSAGGSTPAASNDNRDNRRPNAAIVAAPSAPSILGKQLGSTSRPTSVTAVQSPAAGRPLRDDPWMQGVAVALAVVYRNTRDGTTIKHALIGMGITVDKLREGGAEEYDLRQIEEAMR